jgi:hypothetical protein
MTIRDLSSRLNGNSEAWRPADNEDHPNPLVGEVVEVETGEGDYGAYPILTIVGEDGAEWRWSVFGGVAQKRVAQLGPMVGDKVGAKYLGEEPSRNYPNRTYRNWKVVLERNPANVATAAPAPAAAEPPRAPLPPASPDWKSIAANADDDAF